MNNTDVKVDETPSVDQMQELMKQYISGNGAGKRGITKPIFNRVKARRLGKLQKMARRVQR